MGTDRKKFWYGLLVIAISYSLGLLFIYAAASKLLDFEKFKVQIGQSAMLTDYAGVLAWLVPAAEIVIAVMLVFEGLRLPGLFAAFGLMMMFTAYIVVVLTFAERVPCARGGILEKMSWLEHLVFNIVFLVLAGIGVNLETRLKEKGG